jgi:hypothetical protein
MKNSGAIAKNIRVALVRADKRQDDIVQALGLPKASVSGRMNGRIDWRLDELRQVAELLDVPLSQLVDETDAPKSVAS